MIVGVLILLLVELPLAVCWAIVQTVRQRPIVQKCYACLLEFICDLTASILEHPKVVKAAGDIVAEGMNTFLMETSRIEQHMKNMAETMSKAQPEFARKQGEDFPIVVGSFLQGILKGAVGKRKTDAASKDGSTVLTKDEHKEEHKEEQKEEHKEEILMEEETKPPPPIVMNSSGSDSEVEVSQRSKRRMIIHLGGSFHSAPPNDAIVPHDTVSVRSALSGSEHNLPSIDDGL